MKSHRKKATDTEVGRRLRLLRLERRVSQTELGDSIGVTFQQIQKYEKGTNRLSAGALQAISDFFRVPITYFFGVPRHLNADAQVAFSFLEKADALRLLKAFSQLADDRQRAAFVRLAESMAASRKSARH